MIVKCQRSTPPALSHYSDVPLGELRSHIGQVSMDPRGWQPFDKPHGLWVSVDGPDDWPAWCEGAGWRPHCLAVRHRITLNAHARLLWLTERAMLRAFEAEYGIERTPADMNMRIRAIDWGRVAESYAGIIIAPYQWELRLSMQWYYTWDCASGCIWDTGVIERVTISRASLQNRTARRRMQPEMD